MDGQTYLEGKRFEHKIYGGTSCQVFDEVIEIRKQNYSELLNVVFNFIIR